MKVTSFELKPLEKSEYLFPYLATYTQESKQKTWEIVKAGDSVAILLYHQEKDTSGNKHLHHAALIRYSQRAADETATG